MKKKLMIVLILCLVSMGLGGYAGAAEKSAGDTAAEMIDTAVAGWIEDGRAVGAVVSVVQNGQVHMSQGYGYADTDAGIEADAGNTAFRIGSVSKVFTAQAAMHLWEQGRLDMTEPVSTYLEENFPAFAYPVSMHDLLTHTAGLEEKDVGLFVRQEEVMPSLGKALRKNIPEQVYMPGEVSAYSNYGIGLAGHVVEQIAGQSFAAYAQETIFAPLGMQHTTFKQENAAAPVVSKGYGADGEERREGIVTLYPAGSVTATADDMGRYMAFLLDGEGDVLGGDAKAEMFARQFGMTADFPGIGYVWGRYGQNEHMIHGHMGQTDNFYTALFLFPDHDLGVFISCNTQGTSRLVGGLCVQLIDALCGEASPPAAVSHAQTAQIDISGSYVPARSNFTGGEKMLRIPKTIKISGNAQEGFTYSGTELQRVGESSYFHPALGYMSFVEKNGRSYLANEEGASFLRVPWYEGLGWQAFVLGAFVLLCIIAALMSIVVLYKSIKRKEVLGILAGILGIVLFLLAADIVGKCTRYFGDFEYAMGGMLLGYLKATATVAVLIGWGQLITTIFMWVHKACRIGIRIVYSLSSLSFLLFMLWLFQVHLIG